MLFALPKLLPYGLIWVCLHKYLSDNDTVHVTCTSNVLKLTHLTALSSLSTSVTSSEVFPPPAISNMSST